MIASSKKKTLEKYLIGETLGSGICKVKAVQDPLSRINYAAKICKTSFAKISLSREASILFTLNQAEVPNVIQIVDFFESQKSRKDTNSQSQNSNDGASRYQYNAAIVMELAPNDTLFDYVYSSKGFEEKLARSYFRELMRTLDRMHGLGFVHRDIKLENILLDKDFCLKLADFGFARDFNDETKDKMTTRLGTEYYMAPEMRQSEPYCGVQLDIFSSGVLLFLLLFGRPPFYQATSVDPLYRYFSEEKPERFWKILEKKLNGGHEFTESLKVLVSDLLAREPAKRPTAGQILGYEWMLLETYSQEDIAKLMSDKKKNLCEKEKA